MATDDSVLTNLEASSRWRRRAARPRGRRQADIATQLWFGDDDGILHAL